MTDEWDTEEQYLRGMLAQLQESYAKAARPYLDRLCEIHSYRPPALLVELDQNWQPLFRVVEPDEMYEPPAQT